MIRQLASGESLWPQHAVITPITQPSHRTLRADACNEFLHLRQDALDDGIDPFCGRVQSVMLQKPQIAGNAVEEERIEQHVILRSKLGVDALERLPVLGAEIRRRPHAAQQHRDMALGKPTQNGIEGALRDRGLDRAQHVVGAKFEHHRIGALRHRPVEPGKSVRSRITGDAGVLHLGVYPARGQRRLQAWRESVLLRQAQTGGQGVAERDDLDRGFGAGRPRGCRNGKQRATKRRTRDLEESATPPI